MARAVLAKQGAARAERQFVPFRSVNRPGSPGYDPALQRHHLLPQQLLSKRCFGRMFADLGRRATGFDDFRLNGLLLPASEPASVRTGMPLHRGPHRDYNAMVIERVGLIESHWSRNRQRNEDFARRRVLFKLRLLQGDLRDLILDQRRRIILNRKDPLGTGFDFSELDAMAEELFRAT